MTRNGRPADRLDAELAELRRTWGDTARIDITADDGGNYIITVHCKNALPWTHGWTRVDSRVVVREGAG
jgi:hypothetical protein